RAAVDGARRNDDAIRDDALIEYRIAADLNIVPQNGPCDARRRIDSRVAAYGWAGRLTGGRRHQCLRRAHVVGRRSNVEERGVADEAANRSRLRRDDRVVYTADRVRRLAGGDRLEDIGVDQLNADVVI